MRETIQKTNLMKGVKKAKIKAQEIRLRDEVLKELEKLIRE